MADKALENIKPFEADGVAIHELRDKWDDYKKQFKYVAKSMTKVRKRKIKSIFLSLAGRELQKIYENICESYSDSEDEDESDETESFQLMLERLDDYFQPKQHEIMERYQFWNLKLNEGEKLDKFMIRASSQINKCNFGNSKRESRDVALMDKVVMMATPELRKKILEAGEMDVDKLTRIVNSYLRVQSQTATLNKTIDSTMGLDQSVQQSINKINSFPKRQESSQSSGSCSRCGFVHQMGKLCPANNQECHKCHRSGHFSKMCMSNQSKSAARFPQPQSFVKRKYPFSGYESGQYKQYGNKFKKPRVNAVEMKGNNTDLNDSDDEGGFVDAVGDNHGGLVYFKVGGMIIEMVIDSGCDPNIIDETTWSQLKKSKARMENERPSKRQLKAYAQDSPLKVICSFDADITVHLEGSQFPAYKSTFYVVQGNIYLFDYNIYIILDE